MSIPNCLCFVNKSHTFTKVLLHTYRYFHYWFASPFAFLLSLYPQISCCWSSPIVQPSRFTGIIPYTSLFSQRSYFILVVVKYCLCTSPSICLIMAPTALKNLYLIFSLLYYHITHDWSTLLIHIMLKAAVRLCYLTHQKIAFTLQPISVIWLLLSVT